MSSPDYNLLCREYWGSGSEEVGILAGLNLSFGSNPPYAAADLFSLYPKFAGAGTAITGTLASGSATVTVTSTAGISAGIWITGNGIPAGTVIQSVDSPTRFTLSVPATYTGAAALTAYAAPLVPMAAINAYVALASASLSRARWGEAWMLGMGLFVAHYLTLWLRSDGNPQSTPGQAAAAGLATGIMVSKSAGPVSAGMQSVTGLESWGAWQITSYGTQFASLAKVVGGGPFLVW